MTAAISATTAMTVFSYCLSEYKQKNFKEPALLAVLIYRMWPAIGRYGTRVAGWIIHYLVGLLFACIYKVMVKKSRSAVSLPVYLAIGFVTGVVAVTVWRLALHLHPYPPKLDRKRFYGQLLIGHCIFALLSLYILSTGRRIRRDQPELLSHPGIHHF